MRVCLPRIQLFFLLTVFIASCGAAQPQPKALPASVLPTITRTPTLSPSPTITVLPSLPVTKTATASNTPTETITPTVEPSVTFTPDPTYVVLRGIVNQPRVNCYYGPSKAYLYKYGLLKGNRLDIIGYMPDTGYIEVRAIGGDNPCWMNLEFMDVQGDIKNVEPVDPLKVKLPWSPYYPALTFARAERNGHEVTVSWSPLVLKAGDDSEQEPYLLEAWVCRDGELKFTPVGAYQNGTTVIDEPGCAEHSHARVYGVEKHGYTKYLMFDWPPAEDE